MKKPPDPLRAQLVRLLDWEEAHVGFDRAVSGIPARRRGSRPAGFEHSPWQLVEHMRLGQKDILDFCVNARYVHALAWPDDYWPRDPAPPGARAWNRSLAQFNADREKLKRMARNARIDLFATVPTGKGPQTYLRAILLVADHNAYHLGQLVAVRRALGIWP
ncbi:MAG: hypothetical protein A3H96_07625 [Acidobacteria bacterium RIFCSPLOWO2_02_FULL_67_36]|nr:MAG: hypothetical protein A3H96_07625 [Acidobacteria bacterium RIFCSPLOWO2_02_FULL_67_36]OFW23622.1 MAG: hypothetical protein A3G21_06795 [Acidobacteria bacterium RIFCSPLOWO2_12_FULL_66_21]